MNKTVTIVVAVVVLIAVAVTAWLLWPKEQVGNSSTTTPTPEQSTPPSQSGDNESTSPTQPPASDVQEGVVEVEISDSSYSPSDITVKKGTKVVWTNQDSIGHNVVSDTDSPAGGPPTEAPLLSNGQTYEFTFDTVGTFSYHCTPHPFMQGTVTVVE